MCTIKPKHPLRTSCGCVRTDHPKSPNGFFLVLIGLLLFLLLNQPGCVPTQPHTTAPFAPTELESCLTVVVDMSGSFHGSLDEQAYPLLVELMDRFFTHSSGGETRVVIAQLSGAEQAVLYEGRPADLRNRFDSPDELAAFLRERSDPSASPVYRSVGQTLAHVNALPGVTERTRLMTVVLSDLDDNELRSERRSEDTTRLVRALKRYRELGGALALYCVAPEEVSRWRQILQLAGFARERCVVESQLVARPTLPSFE